MFIRRTRTGTGERGEVYYSHRQVRSERSGEKIRQRTLLNRESDFAVQRPDWAVLCARIRLSSPRKIGQVVKVYSAVWRRKWYGRLPPPDAQGEEG